MSLRRVICSEEEVRQLLGHRTVTITRPLKPQPKYKWEPILLGHRCFEWQDSLGRYRAHAWFPWGKHKLIWVAETWWDAYARTDTSNGCVYRADYGFNLGLDPSVRDSEHWKRAQHMPRWASRFLLALKETKVRERDGVWVWALTLKRIQP